MAKIAIKSEILTPFGGIFPIMEHFPPSSPLQLTQHLDYRAYKRKSSFYVNSMQQTKVFFAQKKVKSVVFNT